MKVKSYFGPGGPPEHWETSSGATRDAEESPGSTDVYEEEREESKEGDNNSGDNESSLSSSQSRPKLSDYLPGALSDQGIYSAW